MASRGQPARVALVTGASGAIGGACCRALSARGLQVVVHYCRNRPAAVALAEEVGAPLVVEADLADARAVEAMVGQIEAGLGGLDVLVNNSGTNINALMVRMPLEGYDRVAELLRGTWYLTKLVLRRFMIRTRRGRIVNVSSVVGRTGNRGQVSYTMAKAALDAMTKSLAKEVGPYGILVNSVAPGFIDTPMSREVPEDMRARIVDRIPLGRLGRPEEVAEVVAFLATSATYVHGSVVTVDGGLFGG